MTKGKNHKCQDETSGKDRWNNLILGRTLVEVEHIARCKILTRSWNVLTIFVTSTLRSWKTRWNTTDIEIVSTGFWENFKMKSNIDDCGNEITELMIFSTKIKMPSVKNPIVKNHNGTKTSEFQQILRKNICNIKCKNISIWWSLES